MATFDLWVAFGCVAGVFAHEFGHAAIGWLFRFHVRMISVGTGPILLRFRLGSAWVIVRRWPLSGFVQVLPSIPPRPLASTFFLLGGAIGNMALFLTVVAAAAIGLAPEPVLKPIAFCQIGLVVLTLLPRTTKSGAAKATDGLQLLRMARHGVRFLMARVRTIVLRQAPPPLPAPSTWSPAYPEIAYQANRSGELTESWVRRDVASVLSGLLKRCDLSVNERALALDRILSNELTYADSGVTAGDLDSLSADLVALAPTASHRVTRGLALAALGRTKDAADEVRPLMANEMDPIVGFGYELIQLQVAANRGDSATVAAHVARAKALLGGISPEAVATSALAALLDRVART